MALGYEMIISKDIWKYKSTDQASIDTYGWEHWYPSATENGKLSGKSHIQKSRGITAQFHWIQSRDLVDHLKWEMDIIGITTN